MSERGRKPGFRFYVYRIFDGLVTLYVGKGCGQRLAAQKRKFRSDGEIIEWCKSDDDAFAAERRWIKALKPVENRHPGGNGGRSRPKKVPAWLRKAEREFAEFCQELQEVGSRRCVARFLLRKIDERNCEHLGISKVALDRLREVAHGAWC